MNLGPLRERKYEFRPVRNGGFWQSVLHLLGHVLAGAALFLGLAAVSWGLGWAVAALHAIHQFNPSVLQVLHGVEVAILYLDVGLSGMVLVVGAYRFAIEITGAAS